MQTGITAKLISFLKISLIMILMVGFNDVFAEFYVVYSAPTVVCMSCASPRYRHAYKPKKKYHTYKKARRHYVRRAPCPGAYCDDLLTVYQWTPVIVSPCSGAWVTSASSCYSDELPPSAYDTYPCGAYRSCPIPENYWIPYDPDASTADDRAYAYPNMNWGY